MRNLGGAIGIAACGTILNDRTNLHFERIAETLNATNAQAMEMLRQLTDLYARSFHGDRVLGHEAALKQLWSLTLREAQTQTFADAFLIIALCLFGSALFAPMMRKVMPPKAPSADAH
jgi:DHA2 family multidrug resistance protein